MGKYKAPRPVAIIFDLDGTLVDSGRDIARSANFTRVHFDLPELSEATARSYVGDGVAKLLERILGHDSERGVTGPEGLPVGEERHAEAMAVFADHYGRHLLDHTTLYPGVLEILARYREVPLHVATNKPRVFTDAILEGLHVRAAFDRIVAGDEAPARKPDPAHLRACLPADLTDYGRVAVVGDSPNDVNAARALGAMSVGCTYGLCPPGQVRASAPDFVIDAAGDLARLFPSREEDPA
jgi:phosphoglycolate phosphatase